MRVIVDRDNCEAQAVCVRTCAQVFELDDEDVLHIAAGDVPDEYIDAVRRAVTRCPMQALRIEE